MTCDTLLGAAAASAVLWCGGGHGAPFVIRCALCPPSNAHIFDTADWTKIDEPSPISQLSKCHGRATTGSWQDESGSHEERAQTAQARASLQLTKYDAFGPNHGGAFRPFDCGRTA